MFELSINFKEIEKLKENISHFKDHIKFLENNNEMLGNELAYIRNKLLGSKKNKKPVIC